MKVKDVWLKRNREEMRRERQRRVEINEK